MCAHPSQNRLVEFLCGASHHYFGEFAENPGAYSREYGSGDEKYSKSAEKAACFRDECAQRFTHGAWMRKAGSRHGVIRIARSRPIWREGKLSFPARPFSVLTVAFLKPGEHRLGHVAHDP